MSKEQQPANPHPESGRQADLTPESDSGHETTNDAPPAGLEPGTSEDLQSRLAAAEKQVLLAQADLDNFRKRTRRDMQDQIRYACLNLMSELLESVDNLQRAVEMYQAEPNADGLAEGVKMVSEQITKTLENHGCRKIESLGHPFDPNLHQALQMQPSNEYDPNTVILDLRPGFQLYDRLIRPSQVFVSTGPAQNENQSQN